MEKDTLVAYIATERARGVTDDNIRTELTTKGWGAAEIAAAIGNEAVASVSGTLPSFGALISSSWDKLLLHKKFFVVIGVCLTALSFLSSVA